MLQFAAFTVADLDTLPDIFALVIRPYYILKIQDGYHSRKEKNNSYSLRAYSHFLGMYSGTLSAVMKAKRPLPPSTAQSIAERLCLSPEEKNLFIQSVVEFRQTKKRNSPENPTPSPEADRILNETQFHIISEWEHYAVLSLLKTKDFTSNSSWIAQRIGVSEDRVERVLENLFQAKLIQENEDGSWTRTHHRLDTRKDISSPAVLKAHTETLRIAGQKVEEVGPDFRYYGSETMAIDVAKMAAAKDLIRRFKAELSNLVETGDQKEVYRLAIQFFPFTQLKPNDFRGENQ